MRVAVSLKMIPFFLIFLLFNLSAAATVIGKIPTECPQPIKCLNSTSLTFCGVIDGVEENIGQVYVCPDGYECSTEDAFKPCVFKIPDCNEVGSGKFSAARCNQYYECKKIFWWWNQSLNTCPQEQAFNELSEKCVSIEETDCTI